MQSILISFLSKMIIQVHLTTKMIPEHGFEPMIEFSFVSRQIRRADRLPMSDLRQDVRHPERRDPAPERSPLRSSGQSGDGRFSVVVGRLRRRRPLDGRRVETAAVVVDAEGPLSQMSEDVQEQVEPEDPHAHAFRGQAVRVSHR